MTSPERAGQPSAAPLTVGVRAWTERHGRRSRAKRQEPATADGSGPGPRAESGHGPRAEPVGGRWRGAVLILDTETTTDAAQRLTFGVWR